MSTDDRIPPDAYGPMTDPRAAQFLPDAVKQALDNLPHEYHFTLTCEEGGLVAYVVNLGVMLFQQVADEADFAKLKHAIEAISQANVAAHMVAMQNVLPQFEDALRAAQDQWDHEIAAAMVAKKLAERQNVEENGANVDKLLEGINFDFGADTEGK